MSIFTRSKVLKIQEVYGLPVAPDTEPTPHLARIFSLLEAKVPDWNWRGVQRAERDFGF